MKRFLLIIPVALLLFCFSFGNKKEGPSAVAFSSYYDSIYNSDTLIIPYELQPLDSLNDTLTKYLNRRGNNVRLLMFSQATYIIDSIDLSVFPNVEILEFAGDVDVLENRRYAFMDLPKLRLIRCWSVYAPQQELWEWGTKKDVKDLIHTYRPDVRVVFPRREPAAILTEECNSH